MQAGSDVRTRGGRILAPIGQQYRRFAGPELAR